jgi:hypothetical protein
MSALFKGECLHLIGANAVVSLRSSRNFTIFACSTSVRNALVPPIAQQKSRHKTYLTGATVRPIRGSGTGPTGSWRGISSLKSLSPATVTPPYEPSPKRYQHSQAQEMPIDPIDTDHAPTTVSYPEWIKPQDSLPRRHIGPSDEEIAIMLKELKQPSLEAFIRQTIPDSVRASKQFQIPSKQTPEMEMLDELTKAGKANLAADVDTYIGMGYHPTIMPSVIKRNVLENPGWYTSYTPYQPEISQGMFMSYLV